MHEDDEQRINDVFNDVPMTKLRIFLVNLAALRHFTSSPQMIDIPAIHKAYGHIDRNERDFYYWMQQLVGNPGKMFAANLYRDAHRLYMTVVRKTAKPTAVHHQNIAEYNAIIEDHCGTLDSVIRMSFFLNDREPPETPKRRKYRVGLSFARDRRAVADDVAEMLAMRFGKSQVLYDNFHTPLWSRPSLDAVLPPLYMNECDLCAVFISKEYPQREWCGLEMRYVGEMIKTKQEHRIM